MGTAEVVVTTAEPFVRDWIPEVERQTRKSVRLVISPPQDVVRWPGPAAGAHNDHVFGELLGETKEKQA